MFLTKAGQIGKALCAEYKKNPLVMETLALLEKGAFGIALSYDKDNEAIVYEAYSELLSPTTKITKRLSTKPTPKTQLQTNPVTSILKSQAMAKRWSTSTGILLSSVSLPSRKPSMFISTKKR